MSVDKPNIFLDLDNTCISSEELDSFDHNSNENIKKKIKYKHSMMDDDYIVFERPGLQTFLTWLFRNYNVSIWTAASKVYALHIIEHSILTKPDRKLDYIFFSYHGDISEKLTSNPKQLSACWDTFNLINYNEKNTFILDDHEDVYNSQKENCIKSPYFDTTRYDPKTDSSPHDEFFTKLLIQLKSLRYRVKQNSTKLASLVNKKME